MTDEKKKRYDDGLDKEEPKEALPVEEAKKPEEKKVSRKSRPPKPLAVGFSRVRMLETEAIKIVGIRTANTLISKKRAVRVD